jgi:uncharacterized membrane protein
MSAAEPDIERTDDDAQSIEAIVGLQELERQSRSSLQHGVDRASDVAGRPIFVLVLLSVIAAWFGYNFLALRFGLPTFDKPPFAWLELAVTLAALLLAAVIVATQRREDQLADRRAKLTLQLALLSERKTAKIIALLEEIRRDSPALSNRVDAESDAMAAPADPHVILKNIDRDTDRPPST